MVQTRCSLRIFRIIATISCIDNNMTLACKVVTK